MGARRPDGNEVKRGEHSIGRAIRADQQRRDDAVTALKRWGWMQS